MNIVYDAIRGTAGLGAYVVKVYALTIALMYFLVPLGVSVACFTIAYDGSILSGVLGAMVGGALMLFLALIVGFQVAVVFIVKRILEQVRIGERVAGAVFDMASKLVDESKRDLSLTPEQFEETLNKAAAMVAPTTGLSEDRIVVAVFRPVRWMAGKVQRAIVGYVVRSAVAHSKKVGGPEGKVDLNSIRSYLTEGIDGRIVDYFKGENLKIVYRLISIGTVVSMSAAYGIRRLPI